MQDAELMLPPQQPDGEEPAAPSKHGAAEEYFRGGPGALLRWRLGLSGRARHWQLGSHRDAPAAERPRSAARPALGCYEVPETKRRAGPAAADGSACHYSASAHTPPTHRSSKYRSSESLHTSAATKSGSAKSNRTSHGSPSRAKASDRGGPGRIRYRASRKPRLLTNSSPTPNCSAND